MGPVSRVEIFDRSGVMIPYLPLDDFYSLFLCVDAMIVRGEVSLISALHSGTPFYWDMYKTIGGWNEREHHFFLEWLRPSFEHLDAQRFFDRYAHISYQLNNSYSLSPEDMLFLRSSEMH